MTRLQRLLTERAAAWSQAQDIRERVEREERVDLTTDEASTYTAALDNVERLTKDIETEERAARLGSVDYRSILTGDDEPDVEPDAAEQYRDAFDTYMRRGAGKLTDSQARMLEVGSAELRTSSGQSAGTTTLGGFTVPQDFLVKITETLKAYGGIFGVANVIETSDGRTLPWPGNDDTGNVGSIISENTADSTLDVNFTQQSLAAFTYTSNLIRLSLELLQDTAFDLESFVAKKIGQRIGRAVAAHLATGTGTGQPKGVDTASTTVGKTGLTGQTLTVIYDDLVDLIHSVDAAYRNGGNCRFAMADLSLAVVRKLKDTQGHPLWQPSVVAGVPDTLLGYGVTVDNGLPVMAANATSILFGDFNAGYIVRVVRGVEVARLAERFADQRQVGFFGFMRLDAKPDDAAAIKVYKNSAT